MSWEDVDSDGGDTVRNDLLFVEQRTVFQMWGGFPIRSCLLE